MNISSNSPTATGGAPSQVLAIVYWLVVILPLGWGVYQTVQKSKPLFRVTSAPVVVAPAVPAATPTEK